MSEILSITSGKRGRKAMVINWPEGSFTIEDVLNSINNSLTNTAIQYRINQALKAGNLEKVGNSKRPRAYSKVKETLL